MNKILSYIIILFLTVSCKKTKLTHEFSALVGHWQWSKTINDPSIGVTGGSPIVYAPSWNSRIIYFQEKGTYFIFKNGSTKASASGRTVKENDYLIFKSGGALIPGSDVLTHMKFYPNCIQGDSLFLTNRDFDNSAEYYTDVYIRQK